MGLFDKEYTGPPPWLLPPAAGRQTGDALAAKRTLTFFAVAVFVLVVGAAFAFTVTRENDGASPGLEDTSVAEEAAPDDLIGPGAGNDVGPYLEARQQALATATGERLAVVSFDGYASEAEARGKVGPAAVEALLAAAPGAHPSLVTNGLEAWAKSQRQSDEAERNEIRKLLPTVDKSDPFRSFYESEIVRLDAAIANASPTSSVVFGLVVRAPAEALQALAATPGIRLVDVGQGAKATPGAVYRGLRPEETAKVGQPAIRPL
ncbi:MAG TPA: hypothetical protein VM942_05350 [Acidimicrobiales bacterium]|nr:hypothetical protein [Acidimicrobiales bacterium]